MPVGDAASSNTVPGIAVVSCPWITTVSTVTGAGAKGVGVGAIGVIGGGLFGLCGPLPYGACLTAKIVVSSATWAV
ncbi:hypothetical protein GCM10010306_053840 [Streptomyces umbrinus]|nr:hypothetical protein GCM10010306_053840 [Streptomyces umbrinus]